MPMTDTREIVRLAAKGDGVTEEGDHVPGTVPGDLVRSDGTIERGPHHIEPACIHYGKCGGCQLQHADEDALGQFVHERVVNAARGQKLDIGEVLKEHLSPPRSRRRATLHAMRTQKGAVLGFREAGSHRLVDVSECPVLSSKLSSLIQPLRAFVGAYGPGKGSVDIALSLCDQGVDVGISNLALEGLEATEAALDFAKANELARLSLDQGYGPETIWEPEPATVTLSDTPVSLPSGAFLQATLDAEQVMIADVAEWLSESNLVADLFAGLGTFAFAMAKTGPVGRKVLAVEADQAAHFATKQAQARTSGKVLSLHRDLFRNPLQPAELDKFGAVILDPPRAGAKAQIAQIAQSKLERVAYVSCNPSSWARDAAVFCEAGFRLEKLRPIGQFRWSTHVELTSLFCR